MPVLGPIIPQQQDAGSGEAFAEQEEKCLRLTVQPVQILEDQDDKLVATLAHQHPLERL
jgi:hypothetical protein